MIITEIKRSYKKSINALAYGLPESWVAAEAEYTAQIESNDDPIKCSEMLQEQAKKDVMTQMDTIISKMKEAATRMQQSAASGPTTPRSL